MKNIKLSTEYDCLVVTPKFQQFLSTNESLIIEEYNPLYIYPISKKNIYPFKIDIINPNKEKYRLLENSEQINCFLFDCNKIKKYAIEKLSIAGNKLEIKICNNDISFHLNDNEFTLPISFTPIEYEIKSIDNFAIVLLKNKNLEKIILFNISNKSFYIEEGVDFEIKDKTINFCRKYKDFAKSEIEKTITISNDKINEEIRKTTFEENNTPPEKVCYAFLDCIKNKNFFLAKTLLKENGISEKQLADFLKNILTFFPLSTTRFALIFPKETKTISFKLDNNRIVDFYLDD